MNTGRLTGICAACIAPRPGSHLGSTRQLSVSYPFSLKSTPYTTYVKNFLKDRMAASSWEEEARLRSMELRPLPQGVRPPITTNRVLNFPEHQIMQNARCTRIVVHHRYPELVQAFIKHKLEFGSRAEQTFYGQQDWDWRRQIRRLVEKRALVFFNHSDYTVLRDGTKLGNASTDWDLVGTNNESLGRVRFPDYLSYDEMMLGSLLGVSGPSHFINDGNRFNAGEVGARGTYEPYGYIMGLVGPRFEHKDVMDSIHMLPARDDKPPKQHPELSKIFQNFFLGRHKHIIKGLDHMMYLARMQHTAELLLLEANARAGDVNKMAYVYVVGLGLGVWGLPDKDTQTSLYCQAFMESLKDLHQELSNIGTIDFAYIKSPFDWTEKLVTYGSSHQYQVHVKFTQRNPAAKLVGSSRERDQLLVLSYAWDSNSHPGNEYWIGSLSASGDPAAACMSTIGELHNPMVNPGLLHRIEVLGGRPHGRGSYH
ncbi:hypothetical protein F5Y18DRAFT_408175 [Xylariaceae sp. FL1019]|nr:hypothetical protein F5Y18DRAFT_408175 [Xylariaceae sp. FL1019]